MSRIPPLLPDEVLRRVLRVARFNGTCVLAVAAFFGLATAMAHDEMSTIISVVVAGTGAVELHGAGLLRNGEDRGVRWLVSSQFALLAVILGYVGMQLAYTNVGSMHALVTEMMKSVFTDDQRREFINQERSALTQSGVTPDEALRSVFVLTYTVVSVVSIIYQGGLALYYLRRRAAVTRALTESVE
jgi:hypothetical protein